LNSSTRHRHRIEACFSGQKGRDRTMTSAISYETMKSIRLSLLVMLLLARPAVAQAQYTVATNADNTLTITSYTGSGGAMTIPSTLYSLPVTGIGHEAFFEVSGLTSVTIPSSITNIAGDPFDDCIYLTTITVNSGNPAYTSAGGILFNKNQTALIQYPPHKSGTSYTIPNGVITLGDGAFGESDYLTSVTIGTNVTSIGGAAFFLTALTTIRIPSGVTKIGDYAFEDCALLASVYFEGNAPTAGDYSFETHGNTTAYCYAGTSGWDDIFDEFDDLPLVMLNAPNPAGSLQVTIIPDGATNAGAQWQVDGGVRQPSGATVLGLSVGNHTVSFTTISGWTTPSNQVVSVSPNSTATASGTYVVQLPPQVTTFALPNAANGLAYSQQLSAIYGKLPYSWSLLSGSLPSGLTLAANGLISGTPTNNGTFNFTVKVTDALSERATQPLTLTVGARPSIVAAQPTNNSVAVTVGNNVCFAVSVMGTGPFSYQWQLNGTNLPNGIITTVAGGGTNYPGDGGAATNAEVDPSYGVAVDASGNLFIADGFSRIRKVGTNGIITTVAGNGTYGYSGDGGAATNAKLWGPFGVAVDATGNLFIADSNNQRIRKVGTNGIITTVAGNGFTTVFPYPPYPIVGAYSGDGGAATNAELNGPAGVAVDAAGNLFIADSGNSRIRKVGTNGIITTVAGNGTGYSGDGGAATNAGLYGPDGVTVDATGNLFIADPNENRVRKVGTNGIINTVAGNGAGAGTGGYGNYFSGDGGAATNAELNLPQDVVVDATGNLFIADSGNLRIREVDTSGIIITVAGGGTNGLGDGGAAANAELGSPSGVAVDATGNLFIADSWNRCICKVVFSGPTLVLNSVGFGNAGTYDVVVSSPYGSTTSSVVVLTITLPPVVISAPQMTVGRTNFTFLLSGPAGNNYVLQVSTNLLSWSAVSTSTMPVSGSITLSNAISGYNRRFYRVYLQ
jgi:sugar lactone lactonase YvrE